MFQVVFNRISAAEISRLPTDVQLDLLAKFTVSPEDLEDLDGEHFGAFERGGRTLYRFRAGEYRIYFAVEDGNIVVRRVLHRDTFKDFLYRTKLGASSPDPEDEALRESTTFWELIEEGENAERA